MNAPVVTYKYLMMLNPTSIQDLGPCADRKGNYYLRWKVNGKEYLTANIL